jgi:hypothetical protein
MDPEEAPGGFEDRVGWLDKMPLPGQGIQELEALRRCPGGQSSLPLETGNS